MQFLEIQLTISDSDDQKELLMALLSEEGYDSFLETDTGIAAYISHDLFDEGSLKGLLQQLNVSDVFSVKELENKNWNEEWEKNYDPVYVDGKIHIRADFHASEGFDYEILITPKMSFGTGHHATTSLVMSSQLEIDHQGKKILDAGCGTGVLSILAEKRGAHSILAYDCDDWAYENTLENVQKNNCTQISVLQLDKAALLPKENYDLILANINKNVLLQEIPDFSLRLTEGGLILLSGFFVDDIDDINASASKSGLVFVNKKANGQWAQLTFQKMS